MSNERFFSEEDHPHWFWAVCFLLVPASLTALGFVGIYPQGLIPLRVAAGAPRIAVFVSLIGLGMAVLRRRRVALGITAVGVLITVSGFLLLLWLS